MRSPFKYSNRSPEMLRPAVMLYGHYPLSLRTAEDFLAERWHRRYAATKDSGHTVAQPTG